MSVGILILQDQLSLSQSALRDLLDRLGPAEAQGQCRLLLVESTGGLQLMPLHRQRLVLLWSAQRHFVAELRQAGWQVDHREAESFGVALLAWCAEHGITELHAMEPADRPVREALERMISRWEGSNPDPAAANPTDSKPTGTNQTRSEQNTPEQNTPEQNSPAQSSVELTGLDQLALDQHTLDQTWLDQTSRAEPAAGISRTGPQPSPGSPVGPPRSPLSSAPTLIWHPSNAFLWSREDFATWAHGRRQLRMELFYREGRRRFGVLMQGEGPSATPLGGQWNYDHDNRRPPTKGLAGPAPLWFEPDVITLEVIAKVRRLDSSRASSGLAPLPGDLEPFGWAVSRHQALAVLEHFIATRLAGFGPYQDAMVSGQPTLWHSLLSPFINLGLLHPLEVIERLEQVGRQPGDSSTAASNAVPLASLEGVIRQILGWREYTHGLYHWLGPTYPQLNHFQASRPLPAWLEQLGCSGMACMDMVLAELKATGYAHHIQRLMVLANYGLLAGLDPQALTTWFHRQFIDGHDWVMQTNVIGMGLFADGGRLASKPYAASGNYINRMSTYCKGCRFNVKQRSGTDSCPFNSLYWDFLARHAALLRANPRMGLMIKQLDRLQPEELDAIRATAAAHLMAQAP
ncbi:cryptochrome/photolyase family protein [Vulcanococcus limneticus]|uniref:cryptochrome/photolyase family protein n=1 Tax=Vulcanococcus limneticus TaxID=2170428 RepID=UPI00398BECE6